FRRDRSPNGVAWRFPDWTAVGFAFPGPVPRIARFPAARYQAARTALDPMYRYSKDSLLAKRYTTCGDVNPDRLRAFVPLVSGGLVAGRRHPPCPHLLGSHGFTVAGRRTPYRKAFSTFADHFRARRRREIYPGAVETTNNFNKRRFRYPPPARKCLQRMAVCGA